MHVNNTAFVDDFAECLMHRAVSCPEKVSVDVVDRVAAMANMWSLLLSYEDVEVTLGTCRVLKGRRRPATPKAN